MTTIPVTQAAVRNLATALSKIDTSKLKHTDRLDLIAQAFGWKSDAFMHALKASAAPSALNGNPPLSASSWRAGKVLPLRTLGIRQIDLWESLLAQPSGVIINTGATGSGKTTVLAASADHLAAAGRAVYTVVDLDGSVPTLHHPVLVYGEIRDPESAGEVFAYAQAGFLVLATMYAGTPESVSTRLQDLSVPSSRLGMLRGAMSQALIHQVKGGQALVSRVKVFSFDAGGSRGSAADLDGEASDHFKETVDELIAYVRAGVVEEEEVERAFGQLIRSHVSADILGFKLIFAGSDVITPYRKIAANLSGAASKDTAEVKLERDDAAAAELALKLTERHSIGKRLRRTWPF
jgi:hypothetical protein